MTVESGVMTRSTQVSSLTHKNNEALPCRSTSNREEQQIVVKDNKDDWLESPCEDAREKKEK
jgi:hypothetical protein